MLGGDCSIVLGGLLALRRRDRVGLLFVDGHTDLYQPEANINGEAASSDLALATGRGPDILTMFEGYRPLVRDADVVVLGFRDAEEAASYGSQLPPPDMRTIDLQRLDAPASKQAHTRLSIVSHETGSRDSGFILTPTPSMMASCPLWTTDCRTVSPSMS